LANIDIQQGIIEFSGLTSGMGDPAFTNTVAAGATVSFSQNTVVWHKQFALNGNGTTTTVNNGTSANTELAGPVELHGDCVFNVGGTLLTLSGVISSDGGLIKNGSTPLILTSVNTYTGDTRINTGALRLNGFGAISSSTKITIAAGATLTVTGRVDATFTLLNGQTLKGDGVINGSLIASAGATVSPGLDAIGALTISNTIELDEASGTNDLLRCNGSLTYGGTLNLVNLGSPLSGGSSFKLFNAASYHGSFTSINPPTPGPGQTWDTTGLTNGIVKVVSTAGPKLNFGVINGVMTLSWPSGYKLIWQTNALSTGLSTNWVNYPDSSNPVNITINPAIPTAFFGLTPQ